MPFPLAAAGLAGAGGAGGGGLGLGSILSLGGGFLGGLLGGRKRPTSGLDQNILRDLIGTYSPSLSNLNMISPFLAGAFNRRTQSTYMTPEQFSGLFRQLSAPLQEQYGQQQRDLTSQYASRGQLFGGSLTGSRAQLAGGFNQALGGLSGQLGQLDLQLGAQRQAQAEAAINSLLQQILSGAFSLPGYSQVSRG